jgi:hypothetical protein
VFGICLYSFLYANIYFITYKINTSVSVRDKGDDLYNFPSKKTLYALKVS